MLAASLELLSLRLVLVFKEIRQFLDECQIVRVGKPVEAANSQRSTTFRELNAGKRLEPTTDTFRLKPPSRKEEYHNNEAEN